MLAVRVAAFTDLDPLTLYRLLELRVAVFVVEQACAYPELDGRDTEPATRHLWVESDGLPDAYLRILQEPDGTARIGRVATAPERRGAGLATALVRRALELTAPDTVVLSAQSHLAGWYAQLGFVVDGPEFLDDGIPHVPMRLVRPAC